MIDSMWIKYWRSVKQEAEEDAANGVEIYDRSIADMCYDAPNPDATRHLYWQTRMNIAKEQHDEETITQLIDLLEKWAKEEVIFPPTDDLMRYALEEKEK